MPPSLGKLHQFAPERRLADYGLAKPMCRSLTAAIGPDTCPQLACTSMLRLTSKGAKGLGPTTLGPMLAVAGLKIHLVVDGEAFERIEQHHAFRTLHPKAPYSKTSRDANNGMRTKGRTKRYFINAQNACRLRARGMLMTTPKQRQRWARQAAHARWANVEGASATEKK